MQEGELELRLRYHDVMLDIRESTRRTLGRINARRQRRGQVPLSMQDAIAMAEREQADVAVRQEDPERVAHDTRVGVPAD